MGYMPVDPARVYVDKPVVTRLVELPSTAMGLGQDDIPYLTIEHAHRAARFTASAVMSMDASEFLTLWARFTAGGKLTAYSWKKGEGLAGGEGFATGVAFAKAPVQANFTGTVVKTTVIGREVNANFTGSGSLAITVVVVTAKPMGMNKSGDQYPVQSVATQLDGFTIRSGYPETVIVRAGDPDYLRDCLQPDISAVKTIHYQITWAYTNSATRRAILYLNGVNVAQVTANSGSVISGSYTTTVTHQDAWGLGAYSAGTTSGYRQVVGGSGTFLYWD